MTVEDPGAFHEPVMVEQVLAQFEPAKDGEIMDGTAGGGGHSRALLARYPGCRVLLVDRDPIALREARGVLAEYRNRISLVEGTFDEVAREAGATGPRLAGALLDLGVSTHQLDSDRRGFSFRPEASLDMRMAGAASGAASGAELLNGLEEAELGKLFREYGEERRWRRLARAVVLLRGDRPFRVARDLIEAVEKAYRRPPTARAKARVFQALRYAVNQELELLRAALPVLLGALLPAGVIVVISYESLTDRIVKETFAAWSRSCVCPPRFPECVCRGKPLGSPTIRGALRPSQAEVEVNPRSRSARLRSWRKAA